MNYNFILELVKIRIPNADFTSAMCLTILRLYTCQERKKFEAFKIYRSIEQHRNTSNVPRVLLERKVKLIFS